MSTRIVACVAGFVCLPSCSISQLEPDYTAPKEYKTEIRWTSYGIPHVLASDWEGLGYGFAYSIAADAVCVIARDIVKVNGNLSAYMGAAGGNYESDVFYRASITSDRIKRFRLSQPTSSLRFARGYVAGYNRYLRDHIGRLPNSCSGAEWIRPIVESDLYRLLVGIGIQFGLSQFKSEISRASPPGTAIVATDHADFDSHSGLGSNGIAFGRAVTSSGRGILLGNPHYPWKGSSRFHLVHLTIPGVVNSMGVSLYTTNSIAIGFNEDVAWTHTVSTARRYTLYELTLNPDNPLEYQYAGEYRPINSSSISVNVRHQDGSVESKRQKLYSSHYGPIIVSKELPWSERTVYSIRDAVIDNTASASTYSALSTARSVSDIESAISQQGVFWANTIAADRHGSAYYADISSAPNLDAELLSDCRIEHDSIPSAVILLDGAREECEWISDPRSHVAGTLPPHQMPRLVRDDYVSNSNDSHWLTNPDRPLEGYSPVIGSERTPQSLRTRAGHVFIREVLDSESKVTPEDVRDLLYSHRNYAAEILLDDILHVCSGDTRVTLPDNSSVDIEPSCTALHEWDRTANNSSRGVHVWVELWRNARKIEHLFAVPFSPEDPVNTPNGIAYAVPSVRASLRLALAEGQKRLQIAGIDVNAKWGDIQYALSSEKKIPIPGSRWGTFSIVVSEISDEQGYNPILSGNSYVQVISWDEDGRVKPSGVLTYSQSEDPESPHSSDLTELYSLGEWLEFPFYEEEILNDPNLTTISLIERIE